MEAAAYGKPLRWDAASLLGNGLLGNALLPLPGWL